jgi:uncharacterized protein with FMN-binding domain
MKKVFKILITIIVLIVVIIAGGLFYLFHGLEAGKNVEINGLNTTDVKDGVHNGKYKSGRWSNELNVTVKGNKITAIKIADDVTFTMPGVSDKLFSNVIKAQDTKVDAVSGATVTSKAYLKSIENALKGK